MKNTYEICCQFVFYTIIALVCTVANAQGIDPETGFPWGRHNAPTGYISHFKQGDKVRSTRAAMTHALRLVAKEDKASQEEAARVLKNIIKYQDSDPNSKTYGVWPWYIEEPLDQMLAIDYNWADFLGATLISILTNYSDRLPADVVNEAKASLDRACACIKQRDVKPHYTNIAYMGAVVCAAAAELLDKPEYLENPAIECAVTGEQEYLEYAAVVSTAVNYLNDKPESQEYAAIACAVAREILEKPYMKYARDRMKRNIDSYKDIGGFTEYNSPTYTMVVLVELERALQYVKDEKFRQMAQYMHKEVWKTIAMHYHPATGQWSGPFSRAYRDLLSTDERNRISGRAGLLSPDVRVSYETGVNPLPCPEEYVGYFRRSFEEPVQFTENYNNARPNFRLMGTTYLDNELSLGTASYYPFWFQSRGVMAYWNDSSGSPVYFKQRFLHNDRDFASAAGRSRQSGRLFITAYNMLYDRGSLQPGQDKPKDRTFQVKSFKIVYEFGGSKECAVKQLDDNRFEFFAGKVRAIVHLCPESRFEGRPIQWSIQNDPQTGTASLVGVCYEGEEKPFKMDELDEVRIAVGVEFLKEGEAPSSAPVTISDDSYSTQNEGTFYRVEWEPVDTSESPLLAPCKSTKY